MNTKHDETIGEELFIEELGEVRGGAILIPGDEVARKLAEGVKSMRLHPINRFWMEQRPPAKVTTMMWGGGENGPEAPAIVPMNDD